MATAAPVSIHRTSQPTLPGWEAYPISKSEVRASGTGKLDPEWSAHQKFMKHLASLWGREFATFGSFVDEDGVVHKVELVWTVGSEQNAYDAANDGPAGRIHRIGVALSEVKVEEA